VVDHQPMGGPGSARDSSPTRQAFIGLHAQDQDGICARGDTICSAKLPRVMLCRRHWCAFLRGFSENYCKRVVCETSTNYLASQRLFPLSCRRKNATLDVSIQQTDIAIWWLYTRLGAILLAVRW
jgi:hypothetical protein